MPIPTQPVSLFPLGLAQGKAFCNRQEERTSLYRNIKEGKHTLIISPRRYGKTSLALQVLKENELLHSNSDFLLAADVAMIEKMILDGVGQLLGQLLPIHKKAMERVRKWVASLQPTFVISEQGPKVELTAAEPAQKNILTALLGLDQLAAEEDKRVVLMLDEFQQLATLKESQVLEATIRHAAERAKYVSYIFSGSNRHWLNLMFENRARPLYHLCERLSLNRITAVEYEAFLQKAALQCWKTLLSKEVLGAIFSQTALHPYYMNALCSRLWRLENIPTITTVETQWQNYIQEEHNRIATEITELSPNQQAVLLRLAIQSTDKPTGKAFLLKTKLPGTSVVQALQVLSEKDFIYRDQKNFWQLVDPAIIYFLKHEFGRYF